MKKFFAKLVNWQAQRTGPDRFHQPDNIERMKAKEHSFEAEEDGRQKEHRLTKPGQEPAEAKILGPSESEKS